MRTLFVFGVVGLALGLAWGLAVHWLPRAPEGDVTGEVVRDVRVGDVWTRPMQTRITLAESSRVRAGEGVAASNGGAAGVPQDGLGARDAFAGSPPDESAMANVASGAELERDRTMQLIAAGFTPDRALEVVRKQSQLRRASIEREFAATGTIRPLNASSPSAVERQLRKEMGDDDYEKYLSAIGQTTRIRVGDVESDSAAANAGLLSGDDILSYSGRRVFNPRELNTLMLQTSEGATVPMTVVRNGQTMQLYVTGGALGISTKKQ